ncbi:MAG: sulfite exporter TauE/SafE family protein [bacterium]|nr:sulfite exporter TauE/SafE family protein [bacterium]
MSFDIPLLIAAGFFVGIIAGFIGIGGNVVLIPITLELFRAWKIPEEVRTHLTYGTMLLVTVVTAVSATVRQHFQQLILWKLVPYFVLGSIAATQLFGSILKHVHGNTLQLFFAVMIFALGVRWFFTRNHPDAPQTRLLNPWLMFLCGMLVGVISLFTGLGGGVIMIPLLSSLFHVPTKNLAGTSSAVLIFTAASATASYLWGGVGVEGLPPDAIGYVWPKVALLVAIGTVPGSQIGAVLNKKYAKQWFRVTFAAIQILMALWIFSRIWKEWQ